MKNSIHKIGFIFLAAILLFANRIDGQTNVQVVTKTLAGEEKWVAGMKLEINGENALIHCETHPEQSILYEIEIISKHSEKEKAENDLNKMKWVSGKQGKTLFMRNYIELASGDTKPESNLKVMYHIKFPEGCPLTINNYFGEIKVENTQSMLKINSEFAGIDLINAKGEIEVESKFGDISGKLLNGNIEVTSNRANIDFENISGTLKILATVARINLRSLSQIQSLSIEVEKSEISIDAGNEFRYFLDIKNTELEKPSWMTFDPDDKAENIHKVNFIKLPGNPLIQVKQNIGTLKIN